MRKWLISKNQQFNKVQKQAVTRKRAKARFKMQLRFEHLEDRRLLALDVLDLSEGVPGSSPDNSVEMGGMLYFAANDGANGVELWKSNGTEAGTVLVKDINPGTYSSS